MVANKWWSNFEAPQSTELAARPNPFDLLPDAIAREARKAVDSVGVGTVALPVWLERAFYRTISEVLKSPSPATRNNKLMARQMRHDPEIEGPILQIKIGCVSQEWQIEPADEKDEKELQIADFVDAKIRDIEQFPDLVCQLLNSVFYGPGAANIIWKRCEDGSLGIGRWLPIHSDTLAFDIRGKLGVKVGTKWIEDKGTGDTAPGFDSLIHFFTPEERFNVVLMTFQRQGPDFEDPYEAAMAFGGRGLRDVVWYYWLLKQTVMQNWGAYAERFAMGIRIGYFPSGQENGRKQMEIALRNLSSDVSIALPRSNPTENEYEIEVHEPSASRANTFSDLCDRLMTKCKEVFLGQPGTTQAMPGGMGSKNTGELGKTFNRQMKYYSDCVAEVLTNELVRRIVEVNFGARKKYPRFRYSVPDPDAGEWMKGVDTFIRAGGDVKKDEVRKRLGISRPRKGDETLSLETIDAAFGPDGGGAIGGSSVSTGRRGGRSRGDQENESLEDFFA